MKNNFYEWSMHYNKVLLPYYFRFCYLFPEGEEPSFHTFMVYCYRNTRQEYNFSKKKIIAPIY